VAAGVAMDGQEGPGHGAMLCGTIGQGGRARLSEREGGSVLDQAQPETTVLGLDNVPLDLPVAGVGSRALAAFLDYLLVGIAVFVWGALCVGAAATWRGLGWWMAAVFLVGFFIIEYGYFASVETLREGRTFGKWALGLRVVSREGGRPGTPSFLVRNAVRSVDLFVGIPLMALDPLSRRLGDRLAGTLVVHAQAPAPETVLTRAPRTWGVSEAALLETFLRRAPDMEGWRAERLARQLLACIEHDDPELGGRIDQAAEPVGALRQLVTGTGP
jgi:uncharacterized RDD family membrane protein YckC